MKKQKSKPTPKLKTREITIILLCIFVPMILGILSKDLLIGWPLLSTGLLASYIASLRRRSNYILGAINALLLAYAALKNNLFGSFFVDIFIFAPLEIVGFFLWGRNLDSDKNVKIRKFNTSLSIMVTSACTLSSIVMGYLLTKIPTQQFAFLDSTICCIDICVAILMMLRFRETWWLGVISGVLSVILWGIIQFEGGAGATIRLLSATGYLVINLYGAIKWNILLNKKKTKR